MHEMESYLEEINGEYTIKQDVLEKLDTLKKAKESAEKELKALSGAITQELQNIYTTTTKISGYNFTVKGGFYDVEFDLETFKVDHLDLYIKYLKPHQSKITYSLVSATREKKNV